MVTFGDMMSLLLCFFVIIVSMSEMKQDQKFQKVMESIKRAFGYDGGVGWMTADNPPTNSLAQRMQNLIMRKAVLNEGKTKEQGIEGEQPSVKMVRDGLEYTIGGQVGFELGKATLLANAKEQLDIFADVIKGMNNKVRIRGHATKKPPVEYKQHGFATLDDLSYARAQSVKEYLATRGIRIQRMTVEACGASEPIIAQAYEEKEWALNRRVSIIVTESLVEDYEGQPKTDTMLILEN